MGLSKDLMTAHLKNELEIKLQVLTENRLPIVIEKSKEETTPEIKYTTV